jgi:hypothetical protein
MRHCILGNNKGKQTLYRMLKVVELPELSNNGSSGVVDAF